MVRIVHLSDIHFRVGIRVDWGLFDDIVANSLVGLADQDGVVLAVTGDLMHSGLPPEADLANKVLRRMKSAFGDHGVEPLVAIIPGNHDIAISDDKSYESMKRALSGVGYEMLIQHEFDDMESFLLLGQEHGCFCRSSHFDKKMLDVTSGGLSLELVLLNTAPFSTRQSDDKELHYASQKMMEAIEDRGSSSVCVVLMHHPIDWFEEDSRRLLKRALYEHCDLLLVGHEHDANQESHVSIGGRLTVLRGGTIDPTGYSESVFSVHDVNLLDSSVKSSSFRWDRQSGSFELFQSDETPFLIKPKGFLAPKAGFSSRIVDAKDENGMSISQVFTFPGVVTEIHADQKDDRLLESYDELKDAIVESRIVNITGGSRAGKTVMLKALYCWCLEAGFSPLYLDRGNSTPSLSKLIRDLVSEQYGDRGLDKTWFEKCPNEKKLLLIDDFDELKIKGSRHEFIQGLLGHVGHIVFTTKQSLDENIMEQVKASLGIGDHIQVYKIRSFFKTSRDKLIEKVCEARGSGAASDEIRIIIDRAVHHHRGLYRLTPDFIIQNIVYFIDNGTAKRAEEAPFSIIFETNIVNRLTRACRSADGRTDLNSTIPKAIAVLSEFAYRMHLDKQAQKSIKEFTSIVDEYAREHDLDISSLTLFELARRAGLLEVDDVAQMVAFASGNYHSYFVAKRLSTMAGQKKDISEEVKFLFEFVCFDVNENILLFLSYLREDTSFSLGLSDLLIKTLAEFDSLSFDDGNIAFLSFGLNPGISMAGKKTREKRDRALDDQEETAESDELEYRGMYDYDEKTSTSTFNQISKAMKYLEMLGKALIAQYPITTKGEKEAIAEVIYRGPNQILFEALRGVDDAFDQIIDSLYIQLAQDPRYSDIGKDEVRDAFVKIGLSMCLGVYDSVSFSCSNADTINLLRRMAPRTTNGRIQYLLMAENAVGSSQFFDDAIKAYEAASRQGNRIEMISIRAIVNKHLINHKNIPYNQLQKIEDKFFSGKGRLERLVDNRS